MTTCDKCTELERRIQRLEASTPPFWARMYVWALVAVVGVSYVFFTDRKMQVQAQHPDWSVAQVKAETKNRVEQEWGNFSIFTYRPLADQ